MGMKSFSNAKIIVTGAGSGIGMELVRSLYPFSKRILAVDVSEEKIRNLKSDFPDLEGYLITDLSKKEGNEKILCWVQNVWQDVDYCFANAGRAEYQAAEKQNWKEAESLFQLNVLSPIQLAMELKTLFPKSTFQYVITCSAMAFWPVPGYSLYGATKAALLQWARTVWSEKSGDWLCLVFPIATSTGFFKAAGNEIPKAFPLQRPETVAEKILVGTLKRKRKIFPSPMFKTMLLLDRFLFMVQPFYKRLEYHKLKNWLSKQTES